MITTTQKEIKRYLNNNNNLNNFSKEDLKMLDLEKIAISFGVYGMNGGLFKDRKSGLYYVVPNRSTRLFELM